MFVFLHFMVNLKYAMLEIQQLHVLHNALYVAELLLMLTNHRILLKSNVQMAISLAEKLEDLVDRKVIKVMDYLAAIICQYRLSIIMY